MMRKLLLGPPGCGKTTRLLSEVDDRLKRHIPPERIAYASFTRASVQEAISRATDQFLFHPDQFPYWRTIHSLCYRQLGLNPNDVFSQGMYAKLAALTGDPITGHADVSERPSGNTGDTFLFLDNLARSTMRPLREVWQRESSDVNWYRLHRWHRCYTQMRADTRMVDFTDMLERYAEEGEPIDVDAAFIDEGQDLTPLQWKVMRRAFSHVPEVVIAGDDDQAIFTWAGADGTALMRFRGDKEVLARSYRLCQPVYDIANKVVRRISRRNAKAWAPAGHPGAVLHVNRPEEVDLHDGKRWLLLARTRAQLRRLEEYARRQGVFYTLQGMLAVDENLIRNIQTHEADRRNGSGLPIWHEHFSDVPVSIREHIIACLRRGEKVSNVRVRIETIHGAKGKQADNVMMLTDFSEKVRRGIDANPDAELRVLYVGLTRAMQNLFLVNPIRYDMGYRI